MYIIFENGFKLAKQYSLQRAVKLFNYTCPPPPSCALLRFACAQHIKMGLIFKSHKRVLQDLTSQQVTAVKQRKIINFLIIFIFKITKITKNIIYVISINNIFTYKCV